MQLDVEYLNHLIDDVKGVKRSFLAEKIGCSQASFYNKSHGITDFTFQEAVALFEALGADEETQQKIFVKK